MIRRFWSFYKSIFDGIGHFLSEHVIEGVFWDVTSIAKDRKFCKTQMFSYLSEQKCPTGVTSTSSVETTHQKPPIKRVQIKNVQNRLPKNVHGPVFQKSCNASQHFLLP